MVFKETRWQQSLDCTAIMRHLVECLPATLFEQVIGILYPDIKEYWDQLKKQPISPLHSDEISEIALISAKTSSCKTKKPKKSKIKSPYEEKWEPQNPYYQFIKRVRRSGGMKSAAEEQEESFNVSVRTAANQFCSWLKEVGGEDEALNVDPDYLIGLFAMDDLLSGKMYEPIEVVQMENGLQSISILAELDKQNKKETMLPGNYKVRHAYGDWAIDPEIWKALMTWRMRNSSFRKFAEQIASEREAKKRRQFF